MNHFVTVLRHASGDCSLNGISARHENLDVVGAVAHVSRFHLTKGDIQELSVAAEGREDRALVLVLRQLEGKQCDYLVPFEALLKREWTMMGGNFAYSSDSRWHREISEHPLPIHDRIERSGK